MDITVNEFLQPLKIVSFEDKKLKLHYYVTLEVILHHKFCIVVKNFI